ncbi:hypothetical protein EDC56_2722 [Sinobacterium caligoides]|uniref:Nitrate/nitrite sensing protein n=1 Tax=Sinobacterium caligoides TaxID=933926 RepID=A0A3N2DJX1_9GAMM|nr:hypothetical protein [Sinobacterium caligoides]ROS00086.1 hypothetical protein EDC56_2722 [Sinobacterium caligoides]
MSSTISLVWLSLLVFVTILTTLVITARRQSRLRREHQQAGLQSIAAMLETMRFIQKHRGLTSNQLSTNNNLDKEIQHKRECVNSEIHSIEETFHRIPFFKQTSWEKLTEGWESLSCHWRELEPLENITAHCHLIKLILQSLPILAAQTRINCSAVDHHLHYLLNSAPQLLEQIGQFRSLSVHALSVNNNEVELIERVVALGDTINQELIGLNSSATMSTYSHQALAETMSKVSRALTLDDEKPPLIDDVYRQTSLVIDELLANIRHQLLNISRSHNPS